MPGKLIFVAGAAIGYVLGSRAGHQRYEQIAAGASKLWNTRGVQKQVVKAEEAAGAVLPRVVTGLFHVILWAVKKAFGIQTTPHERRSVHERHRMSESSRADGIHHAKKSRSLLTLLTDIPNLVKDLVKGEIQLLKTELIAKAKLFGIGAGLVVGALLFLFLMLLCLIIAGILALSLVMPGWLAALLVAALFLVIAAGLGYFGYTQIKKGLPPLPKKTIDSVKSDVKAVKGVGRISPLRRRQ